MLTTIIITSVIFAAVIGLSVLFGCWIEKGWDEITDEHEDAKEARG